MLRKILPLALAALALAAPAPTRAQSPSLEEILSRHYEAIGGLEDWMSLESMRAKGTLALSGFRAPFEMVVARPDRARMEFRVQGTTGVQAYDGETAWMFLPFMGQTEPRRMPEAMAKELVEQADIDGPLVGYAQEGHELRLVGVTVVGGTTTYEIEVTLKSGGVRNYFLDAERYVPIRITGRRDVQGTTMDIETSLGDYREVGGLLFPHSIHAGSGATAQTLTIEEMELNVDPDPGIFAMPGGGDTPGSGSG